MSAEGHSASFVLDGDGNGAFGWLDFLNSQFIIVALTGVHVRHGSLAALPPHGGALGMQYLPAISAGNVAPEVREREVPA